MPEKTGWRLVKDRDRALLQIDVRPLALIAASGALIALWIGVGSLLVNHDILWFTLYLIIAGACFVGGARFAHRNISDNDITSEMRFALELFGASLSLVPAHVLGLFLLARKFDYNDPLGLCLESIFVGIAIGAFPAILKFIWLSRCRAIQAAAIQAGQEAERLMSLEQFSDAEEKLRESILAHEVQFGTNHVLTARVVLKLARVFGRINEKDKAGVLIRRSLVSFEQILGPNAPEVADCVLELVKVDPNTDAETVLPLLRRAQIVREQQFGADSREVAEVCSYLGAAHFGSAKWAEAVEVYRRGLTILEKILPDSDPDRIQMAGRLASSYVRAGRPIEAEKLLRSIIDTRKQLELPPDGDYLLLLSDYAQLHHRQGKVAEEKILLMEAIQVLVEHVGPTHPAREEVLKAAVDHLSISGSAENHLMQSMLSADGVAVRKACEVHPTLVETPDAFGWRPLQWAVFLNLDRIIDTFIYAKAPLEKCEDDWPPIQIAIRWGLKRPLSSLLAKGISTGAQSVHGWTTLHRACQANDDRTIDVLVAKGASPNLANSEGDTPLLLAARLGQTRCVVELLHHGADPLTINETTGRSALHEAASRGLKPVVECIILNCADAITQVDGKGRSAAELARLGGHTDLVAFIEKSLKLDKKERDKEEKNRDKDQLKSKEVTV